ncbi:MAG: exonuclease V subunit gamma [Betaproteobacteria bacterium]|nr:exonuclease V subunit gamma [Betaproteobacteria bacterium]
MIKATRFCLPPLHHVPPTAHPPPPQEPSPGPARGSPFEAAPSAAPSAATAAAGSPRDRPGFKPGLLWLQAPLLEDLAQTVHAWWARYPASPLEEEVVLVPSNGMAEWFKGESARQQGIFSGFRVELPARFAWRLYRSVLGVQARGGRRTDKSILPWYLAARADQWGAQPRLRAQWLAATAASGDDPPSPGTSPWPGGECSVELYRWCVHAADLFDQYQLFRPDWLKDWAQGHAQLRVDPQQPATARPVPPEQHWQVDLWQWLMREASSTAAQGLPASRAALHEACIQHLRQAPLGALPQLPARVVLFGSTSLPPMILELLDALSRHALVVLAVPNPCQVQWVDLSDAPHEGHPLLAAWGKQARDFLTQVDRFEERIARLDQRGITRVEHEAERPAQTALTRLQASIHLNEPLHEVAHDVRRQGLRLDDGSIRFVRAHTPLRELEILHDHLLHQLTGPDLGGRPQPRDVVVMVPDLRTHAAAIRAVFGAYSEQDPRHIPWGIADQQPGPEQGLPELADWLLALPSQRCTRAELLGLLQSSAVCRRWGLDDEDQHALQSWVQASGIRWGLTAEHRESLGFAAAGHAMTWQFGVDRMLAGYAAGAQPHLPWAPLDSVRGLAARAAGQLAGLLRRLEDWRLWACQSHPPAEWARAFRQLWSDLVEPSDRDQERDSHALEMAVGDWLRHTQDAEFNSPIGYALARLSIMDQLSQPAALGRFRASGVTFCTLMPLRAIPFRVVCLLGMDEGQYPRPIRPRPGDLMALPETARPGDRSRRIEDRQLMLDALLSARQHLLVSWVGQQAVDNQHRPASVLVGQLRETVAAIWGPDALRSITLDHPLQPFSAAYFMDGPLPPTHAHEWQPHVVRRGQVDARHRVDERCETDGLRVEQTQILLKDPDRVLRWLKCPVAAFWEERLGIRWPRGQAGDEDDEPLAMTGLNGWAAWNDALGTLMSNPAESWAQDCWTQLQQKALLPLAAPGRLAGSQLLGRLRALRERLPSLGHDGQDHRLIWAASPFTGGDPWATEPSAWRLEWLIEAWWLQTCQAAQGPSFQIHLLAPDAWVDAGPSSTDQARHDVDQVSRTLILWMSSDQPQPATARLVGAHQRSPSHQQAALMREAQRNPAWRRSFAFAPEGRHAAATTVSLDEWQNAMTSLYAPFWQWCVTQVRVSPIVPVTGGSGRADTGSRTR